MKRSFAFVTLALVALAWGSPAFGQVTGGDASSAPLNVLLITADDMNFDSIGAFGCTVDDITPNLDRFASEGMMFNRAHVNVAVCQPCRQVLMTGRYPHNNGGTGFNPIRDDVPTLQESLSAAGYYQGILAKVIHLDPREKYCWDYVVEQRALHRGRSARLYYERATEFFAQAQEAGRPFFMMANAQDPHRPFARGSEVETPEEPVQRNNNSAFAANEITRWYHGDQIVVPGFLPDLPEVRQEIAEYFTSVHRCDEVVGEVLRALDESGMADNTIVMFLSDHGMALPFAKTNCWYNSTRTPWMVRWPGVVEPGSVNEDHYISTIDYMPTVLEAAGVEPVDSVDGRSFLPLLSGEDQDDRDTVYTVFHTTAGRRNYPMRTIHHNGTSYIRNFWCDGETSFHNESQNGRTMAAMRLAAETDEQIAERVDLFLHRVPEELYNYEEDPCALNNLIDSTEHQEQLHELRQRLLQHMQEVGDPLAEEFAEFLEQAQ